MAVDALGLALTERMKSGEDIPQGSGISGLEQMGTEDGVLVLVEFDLEEYNRKHNSRSVKKTLSIPEWLNEAAVRQNINFSQVLQEALMKKVN